MSSWAPLKKNKRLRRPFSNQETGFKDLLVWMRQGGYTDAHVYLEATGTYSDASALFLA